MRTSRFAMSMALPALLMLAACALPPSSSTLTFTSDAFGEGDAIPARYTCDGANISPPLLIGGVPEGTRALAIIMADPDAQGGTFTHWTIWNIDPATESLREGAVLSGVIEGVTGTGEPGYVGPCPPTGMHRYVFTLYALSDRLNLPPSTSVDLLEAGLAQKTIAKIALTGVYERGLAPSSASSSAGSGAVQTQPGSTL